MQNKAQLSAMTALFMLLVSGTLSARAQGLDQLAAPMVQSCEAAPDKNWCRHGLKKMQDDLPLARKGNYQAMRNVAWCMIDGCDGAVRQDRAGGCGWRRAIMQLHGHQGGRADKSDEANLALCSGWRL